MNNLKKLGLTALAGSLVAVSAQAGELSVSGSANMTYKTNSGSLGKGIGQNSAWSMSGSGELDNGWTIAHGIALTDAQTLSSSNTKLTMGSMGSIVMGQGYGGVAASYDEEVPQAYEQTSDRQQNSANQVGNWMDNGGLTWTPPAFSIDGLGSIQAHVGFSPDADDVATNNGSVGAKSGTWGAGKDLGLTLTGIADGLTIGAYGATRENESPVSDGHRDEFNGTWYAKYTMGSVSVGYSEAYYDSGIDGTATAAATAKAIGTSDGIFENSQMSIAFNVNDNLSISYTESEDTYDSQSMISGGTETADVTQETEALQLAYSMGGMSIKAFQMEANNPGWDSDATTNTYSEISIGLSF